MKLVPEARHAWRWFSVQAMAACAAVMSAWVAMPADLKSRIPETWVDVAAIALLALGIFGRLVDQPK